MAHEEVPNSDAEDIAIDILRSLRRILHAVTVHSKRLARTTGLTLPQVACLRTLDQRDGKSATVIEISRALQASPPTITGIVDRLERAGLVRKERGISDRRKVHVTLTEAGQRKLRDVPEQPQEKFLRGVHALDPRARGIVQQSLHTILELLEAPEFDAAPLLTAEEKLDDEPHG